MQSTNYSMRSNDQREQKPVLGPQAKRYNPNEDGRERKFKGGSPNGQNDTLCKNRYQQISVTALGNLVQNSTRILQAAPSSSSNNQVYKMSLTVGSTTFTEVEATSAKTSGSVIGIMTSAFTTFVLLFTLFFY